MLGTAATACHPTGDAYNQSLESKAPYSVLQGVEFKLRATPKRPYIYEAHALHSDIDVIALPLQSGGGYAAFTAKAGEGRVLSVPEDGAVSVDLKTLRELISKRLISDAVAAELIQRSA